MSHRGADFLKVLCFRAEAAARSCFHIWSDYFFAKLRQSGSSLPLKSLGHLLSLKLCERTIPNCPNECACCVLRCASCAVLCVRCVCVCVACCAGLRVGAPSPRALPGIANRASRRGGLAGQPGTACRACCAPCAVCCVMRVVLCVCCVLRAVYCVLCSVRCAV